jgi:hypothetical protein
MKYFKKIGLVLLLFIMISFNSNSQNNMVEIIINKEAEEYISKNNIEVLTIYLKIIPCGCTRPIEIPTVGHETPKETEDYFVHKVKALFVYVSKKMSIPENTIEVGIEVEYSGEIKLHPSGIEYFIKGVGNYCKLPTESENNYDN